MRSLNLDQLETLQAIAETQSFSAAARRLNLSQPAVSAQIRELEARFGVSLLERLGKKAVPTAAGRDLIAHAQHIALETEAVMALVRRRREGWLGRVRLGTSTIALNFHLPPVLRRLRSSHPYIELAVTSGTTVAVLAQLQRNELDAGIVNLPIDDRALEVVPLCEEPLVAIFPPDAKGAPLHATPQSLVQHSLIFERPHAQVNLLIVAWFAAAGFAPRPAMELDNLASAARMVGVGLGVSIVPERVAADAQAQFGVLVRPLMPALSRTLAYVQRRDKPDEPALRIVREALMALDGTPPRRVAGRAPARKRAGARPRRSA
jgi:DNA-binding transcriptional LysR family regulator